MNSTDNPWWGDLLEWTSQPNVEVADLPGESGTIRAGLATVPNYYAPIGAHAAAHVWCLADPVTGLPGAVLSERRYVARMFAEAALTEAAALGANNVSAAIDRIDGIPALAAVLASHTPTPVAIAGWLVAAAQPHRARIRVHFNHGTTGAAEHVADVTPVWESSPIPMWRLHYAGAEWPHPVTVPSWVAAAAEIITATDPTTAKASDQ